MWRRPLALAGPPKINKKLGVGGGGGGGGGWGDSALNRANTVTPILVTSGPPLLGPYFSEVSYIMPVFLFFFSGLPSGGGC